MGFQCMLGDPRLSGLSVQIGGAISLKNLNCFVIGQP